MAAKSFDTGNNATPRPTQHASQTSGIEKNPLQTSGTRPSMIPTE